MTSKLGGSMLFNLIKRCVEIALAAAVVAMTSQAMAVPPPQAAPTTAPAKPPTPEEWARFDKEMADLLKSREGSRSYIKSLKSQLGPESKVVARREAELKDLDV